jgi:hypothetical protein
MLNKFLFATSLQLLTVIEIRVHKYSLMFFYEKNEINVIHSATIVIKRKKNEMGQGSITERN